MKVKPEKIYLEPVIEEETKCVIVKPEVVGIDKVKEEEV